MKCCKSSPRLEAINIMASSQIAIINVCGEFPDCGTFSVCMRGCSQSLCSGAAVSLCDSNSKTLFAVNCKANNLTLGQAQAQALRQGVLHFRISADYPDYAAMTDKLVCSPTPIFNNAGTAVVDINEPVATIPVSTKKAAVSESSK